jgi:hypothetical protein
MFGGGGLKRPRLKLSCSAIEETYCYESIFAARSVYENTQASVLVI